MAACVRSCASSFLRIFLTWVLTVSVLIVSFVAIRLFEFPAATKRSTSISRDVNCRSLEESAIGNPLDLARLGESFK